MVTSPINFGNYRISKTAERKGLIDLQRIPISEFIQHRQAWETFTERYFEPCRKYKSIYALKQSLTSVTGKYLYTYDCFVLLTGLGFTTWIDQRGKMWVKAKYNKQFSMEAKRGSFTVG